MLNTRPRNLWIALNVVLIFFVIAKTTLDSHPGGVTWIVGLITVIMVFAIAATRPLWARSAWTMVGVALLLQLLSSAPTSPAPDQLAEPGSTIQNIFHIVASIVMVAAAIWFVHRRRRTVSDISGFLDSAIVFVAATIVAADRLIFPLWHNPALSTGNRQLLVTYVVLDLVLLSVTVRLWFSADRIANRSIRMLSAAFVLKFIGDVLSLSLWVPHPPLAEETVTHITTVVLICVYTLIGAAVLDPTATRPPAGDVDAALTARSRVLVLLGTCILIPPTLVLFFPPESGNFTNSRAFIIASIALTALVLLRVNLLVQGYRESVRRENVLREINAGLMRTGDLADVEARLPDWAGRLVEQPDVGCHLATIQEMEHDRIAPAPSWFRNEGRALRYRTVVPIPGVRPARRLVVDAPDIIGGPAQASLAVLGQSVGMAMERLALSRRILEQATTERLELLLHNASDVIALLDSSGTVNYVTEAMRDLTGAPPSLAVGRQWPSLFTDQPLAKALLDRAKIDGEATGDLVVNAETLRIPTLPGEPDRYEAESTDRRVDVDVAWISPEQQFVVTHHDVTERYQLQQKLAFQAYHDELTGLNNRAVFRSEIKRAAARSRRSGTPFAVLMLDLDDFKNINDSLGHPAGDELLRVVANRLVSCMREGDTPVRLGGDEFAVILESAQSEEDARAVADRVLDRIREPVDLLGNEVVVGTSIGIALSSGESDAADVERDADLALYEAKYAGKGRVAVYRSDMHDSAVNRLSMTSQLRVALERGEIHVLYQPVVDLATGGIAGAEALVRWVHPTEGELSPNEFIRLAEETGIIVDIGRYVLATALHDLASWTSDSAVYSNLRMSVNVSVRQLQIDNIAEAVSDALVSSRVLPERVVIEVTESVLLPDDGVALMQLRAVADLGVSVYVDDFGTGWASLHYLRSLPVTGLKLAQEFVNDLPNALDGGLAKAIHDLSVSMGLEEVIAEGIETPEQREVLLLLGYRLGQGFLMGRPRTSDQMRELLRRSASASWNQPKTPDLHGLGPGFDQPPLGSSDPVDRLWSSRPGG